MSKHLVKCVKCNQVFDANIIQAVKVNARRYAHQTCCPDGELVPLPPPPTPKEPKVKKEEKEKTELTLLKDTIQEIFGDKTNWATCMKQIKNFTAPPYDYSLSGIRKCLIYFYQIKNNPIEKANGTIAIVPYVYKDAYNYFYELFLLEQNAQQLEVKEEVEKEIIISPPKPKKRLKLFKLWSDDDE